MKLFKKRGKKEEKMVTDFDKYINSEIGTITTDFILPKFNRQVAVNAYEGYWAAAIDYNVNAAASGIIRLFAKVSNNGQKCLFDTTKHKSIYQRDYIEGKTVDKPSQNAQYKIMDSREDFEIVQGHPITDLFTRANPYQSTYQFFYQVYLNLEICGDAFIHVVSYPDGTPAALTCLQSQHMEIKPAKQGSGRLIEKYEYRKNISPGIDYPPDEIIHIKYENPDSIWYGMGKIEKGWKAYLLNKFSHEYQIALYANKAVPDYLLVNKSGNSISKKRFFDKMTSLFRGSTRNGGVMAVDGDIDIKTVAFKPKDLADVQLNIQEIASVSGCPINKLIGNDNIKANSEEQNTSWLRNTILPMMKVVASGLSEGLLWRYGIEDGTAFLEYDNPVPEDIEEKRKSDETYSKIGVITPNEVRNSLGMEPLGEELDSTYFNGQNFGSAKVVEQPVEEPEKSIFSAENKEIKSQLDNIVKEVIDLKNSKQEMPAIPSININMNEITEEEDPQQGN